MASAMITAEASSAIAMPTTSPVVIDDFEEKEEVDAGDDVEEVLQIINPPKQVP